MQVCRYSDFYLIICLQFLTSAVYLSIANQSQVKFHACQTTVVIQQENNNSSYATLQRMIYLIITQPHDPVNESLTKL